MLCVPMALPKVSTRLLVVAGLALLATVVQPFQASAHFMSVRRPWSNGHHLLSLDYQNCAGFSTFPGAADAAAGSWTATWTPIWYSKAPAGCQPHDRKVDIFTGDDSNITSLAWTINYERDCFIFCWWDGSPDHQIDSSVIRLNTHAGSLAAQSVFNQQAVVAHELGHSLGLAHNGYYIGEKDSRGNRIGGYSIMDYCCFSYNRPQTHDVNDINARYPGW